MARTSKKALEGQKRMLAVALEKDSNISIGALAGKMGYSKQKAWRILKELEDGKKVLGYTAVLDYEKFGLGMYLVCLKLSAKPIDTAFLSKIRTLESVTQKMRVSVRNMFYVNGFCDFFLQITSPGMVEAKRFCNLLALLLSPQIEKIELSEVLFAVKQSSIDNPECDKLAEFFV